MGGHRTLLLCIPMLALLGCASEPTTRLALYTPLRSGELSPYGYFSAYLANTLEKRLLDRGLEVPILASEGSFESLLQLENPKAHSAALVQADVLLHYLRGNHRQSPTPRLDSQVRAVAKVFPEWLIATAPLIAAGASQGSFDFFNAKYACMGLPGSGTLVTSLNLESVFVPTWRKAMFMQGPDGSDCGRPQTLRFEVRAPRNLEQRNYMFLPASAAQTMQNAFEAAYSMVPTDSIKKAIPGAPDGATTIAVNAVLVVSRDVDDALIDEIRSAILSLDDSCSPDREALIPPVVVEPELLTDEGLGLKHRVTSDHIIERTSYCDLRTSRQSSSPKTSAGLGGLEYSAVSELLPSERFEGLPVAMHRRLRFLKSSGDFWSPSSLILRFFALDPWQAALALLVFFLVTGRLILVVLPSVAQTLVDVRDAIRREYVRDRRDPLIPWVFRTSELIVSFGRWWWLALGWIAATALGGLLVWLLEYHAETLKPETELAVGGAGHTVKAIFETLVLGKAYELRSSWSEWTIGSLQLAAGITGSVLAYVASGGINTWLKENKMTNHTAIVGVNSRLARVRNELNAIAEANGKDRAELRVATLRSQDREQNMELDPICKIVHSIPDLFVAVDVGGAQAIVVLADPDAAAALGNLDADLFVINILTALAELTPNPKTPLPHVIAEIMRDSNRAAAERALPRAEIICVDSFGTELLAQATERQGISKVFSELLTTKPGTNEIYYENVDRFPGYETLQDLLGAAPTAGDYGIIIGGISKKDGRVLINPTEGSVRIDELSALLCIRRGGVTMSTLTTAGVQNPTVAHLASS